MRKGAMFFTALAFFLPLLAQADDEEYYSYSYARLSYIKGDVLVERAEDLGTEQGVVNLALVEGDKLVTQTGRAEVHFGRRNYLRLDDQTEVEFSVLPRQGDDRVRLHLLAGNIYLRIRLLEQEKSIEVHTPDASFYILEEGLYRFEARRDGETELAVIEGSVEAAGEEGSQLVGSRESFLASNGHLGTRATLSYERDDFDYWNEDRDSLQSQYTASRYLPSELGEYESELDSHGSWVYERPYGYVWVPYPVYSDWRPYSYGRWLWYPICGWTWIPYESWGWCAYHYGRWHWRLGLGWYWIPTYHWGPAWVHWYWDANYIGWCPLSWYNRPVVIVDNYFYDRYHHSYYPAHSRALTVVRRSQLQSPNVSRVALNRVEASRLGQINLQSRQPDVKPVINRSGLTKSSGASRVKTFGQPQVRSTGKIIGPTGIESPGRISKSASLEKSRTAPEARPTSLGLKSPSRDLRKSGGVANYPSAKTGRESSRSSGGAVSSSPRKIRSDTRSPESSARFSSPSGIKTYSPSPGASSSRRESSLTRRETSRVYAPSSGISRFGSSARSSDSRNSSRQVPSFGGSQIRERTSRSFSPPSSARRESFSGGRSFSSPSRSIFSAPQSVSHSRSSESSSRSFSSPKSSGFSSSSISRSAPSHSAPSRSSPSRSSPSHSSSGRVVKKNG